VTGFLRPRTILFFAVPISDGIDDLATILPWVDVDPERSFAEWRVNNLDDGGGIPIWKNGEVVGAVAVSGLSSSEDIALPTLGLELIADQKAL
jgi:hypothetical protein